MIGFNTGIVPVNNSDDLCMKLQKPYETGISKMRIILSNIIGHQIISVHGANTIVIFAKILVIKSHNFEKETQSQTLSVVEIGG